MGKILHFPAFRRKWSSSCVNRSFSHFENWLSWRNKALCSVDRLCQLLYLFKVNNWNFRKSCEICSKLIIKSPKLKLVSAIFYHIFIFHQMVALQKLWKIFFISSKKLVSFSRYSNFCIFVFPSFSSVSHCFTGWSKKNLKVYDVINCLNKT